MLRINEAGRADDVTTAGVDAADADADAGSIKLTAGADVDSCVVAVPLLSRLVVVLLLLLLVLLGIEDGPLEVELRFSVMYSSTIGASFLIETRFSDLTLPKCFRMESRRGITGEVACDGHALIDMYA